jgi:hypothetical protein
MRRLGRWLLNTLTALSLLLCAATVVLWIWGNSGRGIWAERAEAGPSGRAALVGSQGGFLVIITDGGWPFRGRWTGSWNLATFSVAGPSSTRSVGWGYEHGTMFGTLSRPGTGGPPVHFAPRSMRFLSVHWVWLTALTSVLPLLCVPRLLRRAVANRRRRAGLCVACSYDLTGNVSGVCPECGTKVE